MSETKDSPCDHDYDWIDESYDHEYGTENCGYWECKICSYIDEVDQCTIMRNDEINDEKNNRN